jgi:hypothetical protein
LSSSLLFMIKVFDGILVYVFHEYFDIGYWEIEFIEFIIENSCMATLTPIVIMMKGFTFQPLFWQVLISGSYLVCLCLRAWLRNMFWQYVNLVK